MNKMSRFKQLSSVRSLFENTNGQYRVFSRSMLHSLITCAETALIQVLVNALMLWVIGTQPYIIIEKRMCQMIDLGVGHLKPAAPGEKFDVNRNDPVYIEEPLMILSLSSLFEKQTWTQRKTWLSNSICVARTKSSAGSIFEETTMMVLMEKFGGKYTALGEVFNFGASSSLGSREVTLVSLTRMPDGTLSTSEASWTSGSSDCFGFKAQSVEDVLSFLENPKGKAFLFPHVYMGPDLIGFFKDKETSELIIFLLQAKLTPKLDSNIWLKAINSITPGFFYTLIVCIRYFISYLSTDPLLLHL